ncbi:hypothetical protein ACJZ2D_002047 [Fusarium nematophilum]
MQTPSPAIRHRVRQLAMPSFSDRRERAELPPWNDDYPRSVRGYVCPKLPWPSDLHGNPIEPGVERRHNPPHDGDGCDRVQVDQETWPN